MKRFKNIWNKMLKDTTNAVSRYSISVIAALLIAILQMVLINFDLDYNSMIYASINAMQLSLMFVATFSLAITTFVLNEDSKVSTANLISIVLGIITFSLLYFFSINLKDNNYVISSIASARVIALSLISLIAFVYFGAKSKLINSFADNFLIFNRALFTSLIYWLVLMVGINGVIGAFEALVYNNMSEKVYLNVIVIITFVIYVVFLGYFPKYEEINDTTDYITKQPKFIYILLNKIILPIMIALSTVLLLWVVRVSFDGMKASFQQLASISTAYVIVGIWLHILVDRHNNKLAVFYKTAYPLAAIVVLAFEGFAIYKQVSSFGFLLTEYSFTMIWIFAIISVGLIITLKNKAYSKVSIIAMIIIAIWVLPFIGYQDLTFNSQVKVLEETLIKNNMLSDDIISKADSKIDNISKYKITSAIDFITYSEKENYPTWYSENLAEDQIFTKTLGFAKVYYFEEDPNSEYIWHNFIIENGPIDISDYPLAIGISPYGSTEAPIIFDIDENEYKIIWNTDSQYPSLILEINDDTIIDESLETYILDLVKDYPLSNQGESIIPIDKMSYVINSEEVDILLVFSNIQLSKEDKGNEDYYFFFNISAIYLNTK